MNTSLNDCAKMRTSYHCRNDKNTINVERVLPHTGNRVQQEGKSSVHLLQKIMPASSYQYLIRYQQ